VPVDVTVSASSPGRTTSVVTLIGAAPRGAGDGRAAPAAAGVAPAADFAPKIRLKLASGQIFGAANTATNPTISNVRTRPLGLRRADIGHGSPGNAPKSGGGVRCLVTDAYGESDLLVGPASEAKRGRSDTGVLRLMRRSKCGYSVQDVCAAPTPTQRKGQSKRNSSRRP